jgi:hypothetical protein
MLVCLVSINLHVLESGGKITLCPETKQNNKVNVFGSYFPFLGL